MPVSKHRKKKKQKKMGPPPPKSVANAGPKKKKLTKQQITIYIISALVVISMAVSLLVRGGSRRTPVPTAAPINVENLLNETPSPEGDAGSAATPVEATTEPATE